MAYAIPLSEQRFTFADLKVLLARATPLRSGNPLAGVAAQTALERVAVHLTLADLPLKTFLPEVVAPYELTISPASSLTDTARKPLPR